MASFDGLIMYQQIIIDKPQVKVFNVPTLNQRMGDSQVTNTNLTAEEKSFLGHMNMFGSEGYPVRKVKGGWVWAEFFGVKGAPVIYKTKKACVAAIETYIDILIDKNAGRA